MVVMPGSETAQQNNGSHGGWGMGVGVSNICSCSVLSAKWPLVCSEHAIECVEQSDFRAGKQNSL